MQQLRLLGSTIGLTLLIWLAADQSLTETRELQVSIELAPSGGDGLQLDLVSPASGQARIQVVGPRNRIDALARKQPLALRISLGLESSGQHVLGLREELARLGHTLEGVTVQSADPEELVVSVDRIVKRTVPVEIERGALEFEEALRVEPASVTILLREAHWDQISGRNPRFIINLERVAGRLPEGPIEETVSLGLRLLDVPVEAEPAQVVIRGKLIRPLVTATLNSVPIRFDGTADLLNAYRIITSEEIITRSITLRGPRESLDRLQSSDPRVTGVISLSRADAENAGTRRSVQPQFHLPPEVKLVEDPPAVEFELQPIDAADSGGEADTAPGGIG